MPDPFCWHPSGCQTPSADTLADARPLISTIVDAKSLLLISQLIDACLISTLTDASIITTLADVIPLLLTRQTDAILSLPIAANDPSIFQHTAQLMPVLTLSPFTPRHPRLFPFLNVLGRVHGAVQSVAGPPRHGCIKWRLPLPARNGAQLQGTSCAG